MRYILVIGFIFSYAFSQAVNLDSLLTVAGSPNASKKDKVRAIIEYTRASGDTSVNMEVLHGRAQYMAWELRDNKLLSEVYEMRFHWYKNKGQMTRAFRQNLQHIELATKSVDTLMLANAYWLRGVIYLEIDLIEMAIEAEKKAFYYYKHAKDLGSLSFHAYLLGWYYYNTQNYKEALSYFKNAMLLHKQQKVTPSVLSEDAGWIGNTYGAQKDYVNAFKYRYMSLNYARQTEGDYYVIAESHRYLGNLHRAAGNIDSSLYYYNAALEFYRQTEYVSRQGLMHYEIARTLYERGDYVQAEKVMDALQADIKKYDFLVEQLADELAGDLYAKTGKMARAIQAYKRYVSSRDSMDEMMKSEEVLAKNLQEQFKNEQEKMLREHTKQVKAHTEKEEQQRRERNIVFIGLVVVFIFLAYSFWANRQRRKANRQLEGQKKLVESKNKEIMDSIRYARRIQDSFLSPHDQMKSLFKDHFVLYKPKGVVSGDFYWAEEINNYVFLAVADCTGHGVPGAMLSVVCTNALSQAVREFALRDPGKILDKTTELIAGSLHKQGEVVRDGMDISLLVLNRKNGECYWAGANNPLWIVQNNELISVSGNRQSVGINESMKSFTTHKVNVNPGDLVYLFSDGYADQFGGDKGKKFTLARMRQTIIQMTGTNTGLFEQGLMLENEFMKWKNTPAQQFEQTDDVCLLGVRI